MNITYFMALTYGIFSFFSPCILPLLPVYFGYLSGEAINNVNTKKLRTKLIINAIGFSFGVSLLNILLGFGARFLSEPLQQYGNLLRIGGGLLIIFFGLYFIFDFKIPFFEKERRFQMKNFSPSFIKSFILGVTFSFGWTPCNGATIGTILLVASLQSNYWKAGTLMLTYSLGFTFLFLISAILFSVLLQKYKKIYKYFGVIKMVSGGIMIIMGILLITNYVDILNFL